MFFFVFVFVFVLFLVESLNNIFKKKKKKINRYKEGEEYRPHYDWFNEEKMKEMATIGEQRIITVLIYLQTPQKGGNSNQWERKGGGGKERERGEREGER